MARRITEFLTEYPYRRNTMLSDERACREQGLPDRYQIIQNSFGEWFRNQYHLIRKTLRRNFMGREWALSQEIKSLPHLRRFRSWWGSALCVGSLTRFYWGYEIFLRECTDVLLIGRRRVWMDMVSAILWIPSFLLLIFFSGREAKTENTLFRTLFRIREMLYFK